MNSVPQTKEVMGERRKASSHEQTQKYQTLRSVLFLLTMFLR